MPGDIERELNREKEKALKRKCLRVKQQIIGLSISHDSATTYTGRKDDQSSNKKRLQILCIEMEKQIIPIIKDY